MFDLPASESKLNGFSAPYFFACFNAQEQITFLSNSVMDVLGYSVSEMIGRYYHDFLTPNHPLNASHPSVRSIKPKTILSAIDGADGAPRILSTQSFSEPEPEDTMYSCMRDVTDIYLHYSQLQDRLQALKAKVDALSDRELTVLDLVASGSLNKQIAKEIGLSPRTVELTRRKLLQKFDAGHISQVIAENAEITVLRKAVRVIYVSMFGISD